MTEATKLLATVGGRGRRRPAAVVALLTAGALAVAGCSGGSSASSGASGGSGSKAAGATTEISVNATTGTMTENWNPYSPTQLAGAEGVIYEPLYYYNLASAQAPTPLLATAFQWNAAGTELTITTRSGVKWNDGQPFTAKDVAFTFNMIHKTPALNTTGLAATASATNDTTVVLTFPKQSFMQEPAVLGGTAIVPEHVWSAYADPAKDINKNPVGTGPFMVKSFSPETYVLAKNPNYWEAGKPKVDSVRYISLSGNDAATSALLANKVDWMSAFIPNLDQLIKGNKNLSYVNTPALTASLFACSSAALGCTGAQTDPAVRQAIYYAIDRTQLNKLAGGGFAVPASPTLLLPDRDKSWIADGANVTAPQTGDPAKAEGILKAAGYTKGADGIYAKNGQRVSMTAQTVSGWTDFISALSVMANQLKAAGIELKSTQLAYQAWNSNELNGKFELSLDSIGLGASNNPYFTYYPRYTTSQTVKAGQQAPNQANYARYSNPKVDAAVEAAGATNDENVQKQQYAIVQSEIARDLPYIPIYVNSMLTEFSTAKATGWPTNENKYALPATWKVWDSGIVLKNITPAG